MKSILSLIILYVGNKNNHIQKNFFLVSKVKTLGGGEYANDVELVWWYNTVVKSTVFRIKVPILASSLNDLAKILNVRHSGCPYL